MSNEKKAVIYIHGKGGNAAEAEHYKPLFPDCDVIGFDYISGTPWEAKQEFTAFINKTVMKYSSVILIANSIGAFFAMHISNIAGIEKAFFISPIVNMEKLITDMMQWAGVTEEELRLKGKIITGFGETLSWEYLCYVRENRIRWTVPTRILRGENDGLTSYETMASFASEINASLTIMPDGEHWFHTAEEMAFLDCWIDNGV